RWQSTSVSEDVLDDDDDIPFEVMKQKPPSRTTPAVLPISCPGCGAFTQWVYPNEIGFYTLTRKSVKAYLRFHSPIDYDITDLQALQAHTAEPSSEGSNSSAAPQSNDISRSDSSAMVTEMDGDARQGAIVKAAVESVGIEDGARDTPPDRTSQIETSPGITRQGLGQGQLKEDQLASRIPENDGDASFPKSEDKDNHNAPTPNPVPCDTATGPTIESKGEETSPESAGIEDSTNSIREDHSMDIQKSSNIPITKVEGNPSDSNQNHHSHQDASCSETRALSSEGEITSHTSQEPPEVPICDRCHTLKNHDVASPMPCPPISYVRELLEESPYQYNHVYHIIDAADFPLSLIPDIHYKLDLQEQRSKNRRSRLSQYEGGHRKPLVSFVITRSDLLAPTEEQANHLMPYLVNVLRTKLGVETDRARLGNVHMVSAHRGWWTKKVKEKIENHAGGVWMVGKTNVGKSSLLSVVFPKRKPIAEKDERGNQVNENRSAIAAEDASIPHDPEALLPPQQPQAAFPVFPMVSSMPGTTALPVRIPFSHAKGEVIDLPGLARKGFEPFVKDEYLKDLVMLKRIKPERLTIRPGQSLLAGGLVRITALDPDLVILAAPFYNLPSHVTSTDKAISLHTQKHSLPGISIAKDGIGTEIASAGIFALNDDVTRVYGQYDKYGNSLPYAVTATDILIEGCGWVEIIAQIRRKQLEAGFVPKIEVFSPKGRFVASRPSMSAYSFQLEKMHRTARRKKSRPRKSMRRVRLTSREASKKKKTA
ncbi:hypothetical protein KEM54_006108, partial [Ascosphaera aggregata]